MLSEVRKSPLNTKKREDSSILTQRGVRGGKTEPVYQRKNRSAHSREKKGTLVALPICLKGTRVISI